MSLKADLASIDRAIAALDVPRGRRHKHATPNPRDTEPMGAIAPPSDRVDRLRRYRLPREVRDRAPFTPPGTDLTIWTWEGDVRGTPAYHMAVFVGRAERPALYYWYATEARRQEAIDQAAEGRYSSLAYKTERRVKRRSYRHTLKVGDILVASWGYDQTNIDFFEVTMLIGSKMVELYEIGARSAGSERGADYVLPAKGQRIGEPMRRVVGEGNSVKVDDVRRAHPWDGKREYVTPYGMGH